MARTTASDSDSSSSVQATNAVGLPCSLPSTGVSVSRQEASSTTGTSRAVSSTISRPSPSTPRAKLTPKAGIQS